MYSQLPRELGSSRAVDALASKMAAMYQHELRNPLQTIQAAVTLLRLGGTCSDDVLDTIDRNLSEIAEILRDQAVSPGVGPRSTALLSALVTSSISDAQVRQTTRLLSFRHEVGDGEPPIRCKPADVRRALANVFRNAAEARPDAHVRVSYAWDERAVTCSVEDDGPGFPQAVLTHPTGHGLGLVMVCSAIEAHGGSVSLSNAQRGGARVRLALPVASAPAGTGAVGAGGAPPAPAGADSSLRKTSGQCGAASR